jgi:hypothetical protein
LENPTPKISDLSKQHEVLKCQQKLLAAADCQALGIGFSDAVTPDRELAISTVVCGP